MTRLWLVVWACFACACASANGDGSSAPPSHGVVSGAGRIRGGGFHMDVAVGHAFAQQPVTSSAGKLKSASPVAR